MKFKLVMAFQFVIQNSKKMPETLATARIPGIIRVELRGIEPLSENQFPVLLLS